MELGISLPHRGRHASPEAIRDIAQAAEAMGFGSIWTVDHVAPVRHTESMYDLGPELRPISGEDFSLDIAPLFECITTMTFVAAITTQIQIGSAVCVLPLRNPLYNAKQLATLDALSGGRLLLGIGAGWLSEEAEAMGMPWDHRGARTDEHIEILHALWRSSGDFVTYDGVYYSFPELNPEPRPVGPLPILVGGHSTAAKNRAGRLGDGWISHRLPAALHQAGTTEIKAIAQDSGRDPNQLIFAGSVDAPADLTDRAGYEKLRERTLQYARTDTQHLVLNSAYPGSRRGDATSNMQAQLDVMEWISQDLLPELDNP